MPSARPLLSARPPWLMPSLRPMVCGPARPAPDAPGDIWPPLWPLDGPADMPCSLAPPPPPPSPPPSRMPCADATPTPANSTAVVNRNLLLRLRIRTSSNPSRRVVVGPRHSIMIGRCAPCFSVACLNRDRASVCLNGNQGLFADQRIGASDQRMSNAGVPALPLLTRKTAARRTRSRHSLRFMPRGTCWQHREYVPTLEHGRFSACGLGARNLPLASCRRRPLAETVTDCRCGGTQALLRANRFRTDRFIRRPRVLRNRAPLTRALCLVQVPCLVQIARLFERGRARQQGRGEVGVREIGAGEVGVG